MRFAGVVRPPLTSKPKEITVKRYVCPGIGCTRSFSRPSSTYSHMRNCWKVPDNRACYSCVHFVRYAGDEWECRVDIMISAGRANVDCPQYEQVPA